MQGIVFVGVVLVQGQKIYLEFFMAFLFFYDLFYCCFVGFFCGMALLYQFYYEKGVIYFNDGFVYIGSYGIINFVVNE